MELKEKVSILTQRARFKMLAGMFPLLQGAVTVKVDLKRIPPSLGLILI